MADAFISTRGGEVKTVALVSYEQRSAYGSYAAAAKALNVDLILSPGLIDDFGDLPYFQEVGHA